MRPQRDLPRVSMRDPLAVLPAPCVNPAEPLATLLVEADYVTYYAAVLTAYEFAIDTLARLDCMVIPAPAFAVVRLEAFTVRAAAFLASAAPCLPTHVQAALPVIHEAAAASVRRFHEEPITWERKVQRDEQR